MATTTNESEEFEFGPHTTPNYDFESTLHWLYGDRSYLHASNQEFIDTFLPEDHKVGNSKLDPLELSELAKLALAKGELDVAEKSLVQAIRTVMLDISAHKGNPEPYLYLADVLVKKAGNGELELLQRQRFLLQAAALYNFVCNYIKTADVESEVSERLSKIVLRRLFDIQDSLVSMVGGDPIHCKFDSQRNREELEKLRNEIKTSLESIESRKLSQPYGSPDNLDVRHTLKEETEEIKKLSDTISVRMKQFLAGILKECLKLLGTPPCDYEVIVLGSLARNEMTPYSDFEWAILTGSKEEECKVFFRNLTNLVHLQVINLGETILPSMNIEAFSEGWFYDDVTAKGVSFDAFLPQACKTPLGNMKDFELIHTPNKMADFQKSDWHKKNPSLGEILLTVSPLESDKHKLIDVYRTELAKILSSPCDSECCKHDGSSGVWPSRGSCRGLSILQEDLSCYGEVMTGNNDLDDGKFYDVKKEIYRLTDRVFAGLAKCYEVEPSGSFTVLDELYKKGIISPDARDNFASASAIAIKLRISTYLKAGKQGEQLRESSNEETGKLTSAYHMLNDEELFRFFYIAIPLYEELQQLKTSEELPTSLAHNSFFDDSDATTGHVYCRLLNYHEAVKCYERALQQDPENLGVEIRQVRIKLFITKSKEETDKTRENLDTLLRKIAGGISVQSHHDGNQTLQETAQYTNLLDMEQYRQLVEVLLFASTFYNCHEYFVWAEKILAQCLAAETGKRSAWMHMMIFSFKIFYARTFSMGLVQQHQNDSMISGLTSLIDKEGVSTKSVVWLNSFGEFLFIQKKYDNAYRCFQRALSMEHLLYGTKPNLNMMTTLNFLGMTSMYLFMYMESKFYFELLLQLFESFDGPTTQLLLKHTFLQLALLSFATGCQTDETACYLEKGLKITTGSRNDSELILDCILYFQLAKTWHTLQNHEEAWKSAMDVKACLNSIVGTEARVTMTCLLAMTLANLERTNEGIIVLKEEIKKLSSQSEMNQKAFCMMSLGKLFAQKGLASDAENYYKQALNVLLDMRNDKYFMAILECLIGVSKAVMTDSRKIEARMFLDQAFNLTRKFPMNEKLLREIGELCEYHGDINLARQCFEEALIICKESNIAKKLPLTEFNLEVKLGQMATNTSGDSTNTEIAIPLEQRLQAQRIHYDRAAEVLRQHAVTGQVDSTTVTLFLSLALSFRLVDLGETIELLLDALKVCERVYGAEQPSEMVTTILEQLSYMYFMTGDKQATTKYQELLLRMEIQLHFSNPFHEHISHNLTSLSMCFVVTPGSMDTIHYVYEFLLRGWKDEALRNSTPKSAAARCFTSLGVLFYRLGEQEEAETLNEMATQIYDQISESVEREKLPSKTTCDIMKKVLMNVRMTKGISPACDKELLKSIVNVAAADTIVRDVRGNEKLAQKYVLLKQTESIQRDEFENEQEYARSSPAVELSQPPKHKNFEQEICNGSDRNQKPHKIPFLKDSENFGNDLKHLHSSICISSDGSDYLTPEKTGPSVDFLTHTLSQIPIPVSVESIPDTLVNSESIKSTNYYLSRKLEVIEPTLTSVGTLVDSFEYNMKRGNMKQASKISSALQSLVVSYHENIPFDSGDKLISDAIRKKENNNASSAIRDLDVALQLPSNEKRKSEILKLRGECYLSTGDYQTAAINFTEATSYCGEAVETPDDLCEYSQVLIGLIKSKMLCHNVSAAWLICQEGIKLVSDRDHELGVISHVKAVNFFYLGAKCVVMLSENAENRDDKLAEARSLCQQALSLSQNVDQGRNSGDLTEELESSRHGEYFALKCEVQLLLADILLKLQKQDEAGKMLEEMKQFLISISVGFESLPTSSLSGGKPEFLKISHRLFSWIGRTLVMCGETHLSITWLCKSLSAFFSAALPNIWSLYEEFAPLLDALTVAKSSFTHANRSPFEQAIDLCKVAYVEHSYDLSNFYRFLQSLANLYMAIGRTTQANVVVKTGLEVSDLMLGSISDNINNRSRMLLYLAHIHQLNSKSSAFDRNKELDLSERYYLTDRGTSENFTLRKDLSYANFLCVQERFAEASAVLHDINNLGKQVLGDNFFFCSYTSRMFYGPGVQKSIEIDGELFATVENIMYSLMVRAFVGMGKRKEAATACENLCASSEIVHEALIGRRSSCMPYLHEACQHELLSLVKHEDREQIQNCDFPLSATNLAKLYYMLNEYSLALKYCKKDVASDSVISPTSIELKISCFLSLGNDLVEKSRGNESLTYFMSFLEMLQSKEGFLDKPFHSQCATLGEYSFTHPYYVFRSLGILQSRRGNLDAAVQCYERCLEKDEDYTCGQDLVATLAELYQSKALTVHTGNTYTVQMNIALNLFQKLFEKKTELTPFVECSFGSLLSKLERNDEAVGHFENVIETTDESASICFANDDKVLVGADLRREIEVSGTIIIPQKIHAFYELISLYVKLNVVERAQEVVIRMENCVARYQSSPTYSLALSVLGYSHKLIGNKEKAAELFVSVLEMIPGHLPVTEALESCCM